MVKKQFTHFPMGLKISIVIILVILLQSSMLFLTASRQLTDDLRQESRGDARVTMISLQQTLEFYMQKQETEQLQKTITALGSDKKIKIAFLLDDMQQVIASTRVSMIGKKRHELMHSIDKDELQQKISGLEKSLKMILWQSADKQSLFIIAPVFLGRKSLQTIRADKLGVMFIQIDLNWIEQQVQKKLWSSFLPVVLIVLIAGLGLGLYFNFVVSRRIKSVSVLTARFASGNYNARIKITGNDEISDLSRTFNMMANQVQEQHEKILENEQDLTITLNSIGDGVIATDSAGNITRMNPIAEKLTGWSLDEARKLPLKTIFSIIDASTREPITNPIEKVLATGETVYLSDSTTLIAKNGMEYQVADSAAPIRNDAGQIMGMVLVFNDVTKQYQLREAADKSKRNLEAIFNHSPSVIYVKDIYGRHTFVNKQFETLFHLSGEDIIGKTLQDIFPEDVADEMQRNDKAILEAGHSLESEEVINHDGMLHTYSSIKFPLLNSKGKTYAICGISTDITERKKMENDVRSSIEHLKLYQEQVPLAAIQWNVDGEIVDWNKAAEKMFGYTFYEVKGRYLFDIMLPEKSIVDVKQVWKNLIGQTGGTKNTNENLTKDGSVILCEWHNTPLLNDSGQVIGAASLVLDVTQQRHQEEQLRRSQKMEAMGKLTGGIAHDYNNMLGVIMGYTELLELKFTEDTDTELYLKEIRMAAERGKKMTNKLMSFSRTNISHAETGNINKVIKNDEDMLAKTLTARIELKLDLCDSSWMVWLDMAELEDMLINMSINAQYAMPKGGTLILKTLTRTLQADEAAKYELTAGDYFVLSIIDTGVGMNAETIRKIFDPFFTTKGDDGTGLGLSQVFAFVKRSGGYISVYSEPDHGTQFDIYFPRHQTETQQSSTKTTSNTDNYSGHETLLVVDDEPSLRRMDSAILNRAGYKVLLADGGEQALELLKQHNDIVLMISDVIMPKMDGFQLAQQVTELYPHIKIQMVSGFSDERQSDVSDKSLTENMLNKPFTKNELLRNIRYLLDEQKFIKNNDITYSD